MDGQASAEGWRVTTIGLIIVALCCLGLALVSAVAAAMVLMLEVRRRRRQPALHRKRASRRPAFRKVAEAQAAHPAVRQGADTRGEGARIHRHSVGLHIRREAMMTDNNKATKPAATEEPRHLA